MRQCISASVHKSEDNNNTYLCKYSTYTNTWKSLDRVSEWVGLFYIRVGTPTCKATESKDIHPFHLISSIPSPTSQRLSNQPTTSPTLQLLSNFSPTSHQLLTNSQTTSLSSDGTENIHPSGRSGLDWIGR